MNVDLHMKDKGAHIAKLDTRITALRDGFADTSSNDAFNELLELIYRHGYTTPVQLFFVEAVLDAFERNLAEGQILRETLIVGSKAILAESAELSVSV